MHMYNNARDMVTYSVAPMPPAEHPVTSTIFLPAEGEGDVILVESKMEMVGVLKLEALKPCYIYEVTIRL